MNCHSYLWTESEALAPVRASFRTGTPLVWNRVHDVPDYAYFDHSIHVNKGVSCTTCHGQVDQMPLMYRQATLHMEWCLDCHRAPSRQIGPRELVFASAANPVDPAKIARADWMELYHVQSKTDCSVCHR
jgi:hypothetical protein